MSGAAPTEHVDVLIVGAGISGIGAAWHLQHRSPHRTFAILEGRDDLGGTWSLFRYPGIRSDSDMHTLGFEFRPWIADKAIADGPAILQYLRDTARESHITEHIRFGHLVETADWSGEDRHWVVTARRTDTGEPVTLTCGYLFMCSGYYSYRGGYQPEFPGRERFGGTVIHPQAWPEDLDLTGARVVVIGSGATAITLVPQLARSAAHVTMLQRSPTYVVSRPDVDRLANRLRRVLPAMTAYRITRFKNTMFQRIFYRRSQAKPAEVKQYLVGKVRKELGPDFDVERHFSPSYGPWDQRVCLVTNGDLFAALREGTASVVTDHIASFTETGIELESGEHLDADVIVTATGLDLVTLGEVAFSLDGTPIDFADTWTYKGLAYSGVPNLASSFGYINASWTLRTDLICEYVCRLLNHMESIGATECTPRLRPGDERMPARRWIEGFTPGYMNRYMDRMPKQGDREPWINPQDYQHDRRLFRRSHVDDGVMWFR
ncbi:MAG: flavin-containing monooxygenase [Actinomycetes bacterium]